VNIFYVHTDHLNTPRKVSRPSDNKLEWRWDADPFGTAAVNQNPAGLGTFLYNLRFPGQYYMAETGLNYNWNRDYDPATGRYIESDPLGLSAGINTYSYAESSPISNSDPSGLLVRGSGWSNSQWHDIQNAEAKIRSELAKGCSCPNGNNNCVPCALIPLLLQNLDSVEVSEAPLNGDCGWTPPTSPPIRGFYLSRKAWKCRPGCLTSTIYHELLHTTGLIYDNSTPSSPPADYLERKCIGALCGGSSK
jgi:RHS repeat-associated protein